MGTKNNPGAYDCYENAAPDEPMFVLLGRDPVAPMLVALWVMLRSDLGTGDAKDKLDEAETCARAMWEYAKGRGKKKTLVEALHRLSILLSPLKSRWLIGVFESADGTLR